MTSANGVDWVLSTGSIESQWFGITYGNGRFVVVSTDGSNRIMTGIHGTVAPSISLSGNTVTIIDDHLIDVADIALDAISTAVVTNFNCTQTSDTQVTCTFDTITTYGDLVIMASDTVNNSTTSIFALLEPNLPSNKSSTISGVRYCTDTITTFCRPVVLPTVDNPFQGQQCPSQLVISNNMKQGDRNGVYSRYNQGTITEVNILQQHMNRLLQDEYGNQASGPVDGIFGTLTKQGVQRLQQRLNQLLPAMTSLVIDGIVGPFTRTAINQSC